MSYQQINLYQPIFRKQQKVFSSAAMLQGLGVIAMGLVAMSGYALWQSHALDGQLAQLESRREDAARRMEEVRVKFPERSRNLALEADVAALRKEVEARQRIAQRLGATDAGNLKGFADYFAGLARQKPANVWLTEVAVARGGAELTVRGSATQEHLVARYLEQLAREPVFAGREFGGFKMDESEKEARRYDFVVGPGAPEEKKEAKP